MSAVGVQDLTVEARIDGETRRLVDGVSLSVREGSICGVVGETGAGKTLTVRAILGLLPRGLTAAGTIEIGGRAARDGSPPAVEGSLDTAVVLQNPAGMLDPMLRIGHQLVEAVRAHRLLDAEAADRRADELLQAMGFAAPEAVRALYPHQLSGGMAQRAAIAMALMPRPRLLVVDEPTSALDANLRVEVLTLLREGARRQGSAVLIVSHDLPLVSRFCDDVIVMYAGRIVEHGPTGDVLSAPQHPYTQALLATAASSDSAPRTPLATIAGAPPRPGEWPAACVFEPRCPHRFDLCTQLRPALLGPPDHRAACHLAHDPDPR